MALLIKYQRAYLSNVFRVCQSRNTWVFRHIHPPPKTPPGASQRKPHELQSLMKYEVIGSPKDIKPHTIKVILLEDIEGVGHQFDIMDFDHNFARDNLLLPRKAAYASPFDLDYYMKLKEGMKEHLASRVRIPFDYIKIGRELMKKIIPVHVSVENPWKIDTEVIYSSLFEAGIKTEMDTIFLPEKYAHSGPNFEMEAALLRFYIVINKQYVVPITGRIAHISTDEQSQSVYPVDITSASSEQLEKFGISEDEQPYYHLKPELDSTFDVVNLMHQQLRGK